MRLLQALVIITDRGRRLGLFERPWLAQGGTSRGLVSRTEAERLLSHVLSARFAHDDARRGLRTAYARLLGHSVQDRADAEILRWFTQQLGDVHQSGRFVLVDLAQAEGQKGAEVELSPQQRALRRVDEMLAELERRDLLHRGAAYRLTRAGRPDRRGNRDGFEVLAEREAQQLLREMATDPQRPTRERSLLNELLDPGVQRDAGLVPSAVLLLRRHRMYVRSAETGPALTPSQLRKARDTHWFEAVLTDKRLGPLPGEAFELTLPDERRHRGATDADGVIRIDNIPAGSCWLRFLPAQGHTPKNAGSEWNKLEMGVSLATDQQHTFTVDHNRAEIIEVDEGQFFANSSVLLPMAEEFAMRRAEWGHSGLSILAQALRYAEANKGRALMVVGSATVAEDDSEALAEARAKCMEALLKGDALAFASACSDPAQAATPLLLRWASERHGYDCDPDEPPLEPPGSETKADEGNGAEKRTAATEEETDEKQSSEDEAADDGGADGAEPVEQDSGPIQAALKRFRQQHNARANASLDEDAQGMVAGDYEAFFDLYDAALAALLDVEPNELKNLRSGVSFHDAAVLAASKAWPTPKGVASSEPRSKSSRKVDLIFLEGDRPIPALDDTSVCAEHFFVDGRRVKRTYLPPDPPPPVTCVRMTGMYFDTNKCFLLPGAMVGIRKLVKMYEEHTAAELLVVGHTDKSGDSKFNDQLSLERAKAVAAYLTDDVDAWLAFYANDVANGKRWGKTEDDLMLGALPDAAAHRSQANRILSYQRSRGLKEDGIAGPETRKRLIADYMSLDGTTLPTGIKLVTHGCGENFPRFETKDGVNEPRNRRVEMFLFDEGIKPAPAGDNSAAGASEYAKWRGQVVRQVRLERWGPDFVVVMRVHYDIDAHEATELMLVGRNGTTFKLALGELMVSSDAERSLRMYRFEAVPPGRYTLNSVTESSSYCLIPEITVTAEEVLIGDKAAPHEEEETAVQGIQLAAVPDVTTTHEHCC